ncbi:MAG: hypothetical protein QNJ26_15675 [Desulfobacterales bacterium]|nr:hypothetical protein [Desulfobacterales bacterium]
MPPNMNKEGELVVTADKQRENKASRHLEEQSQKVAELYNSGTNCDKAVLLILQEILKLPPEKWDFADFYAENPDADRFLCKALAAGAMAIYLDVIGQMEAETSQSSDIKESIERVNHIFNQHLEETSEGKPIHPVDFDPFAYDEALKGIEIDERYKKSYQKKVKTLFQSFETEFNACNCQDVLGFDPFSYVDYDEEMQEYIEEGEWMQKCIDCMQFLVKKMGDAA